jgi:4-amino-4-deoxy-L-arabinose transferase-like glycosyltransferase
VNRSQNRSRTALGAIIVAAVLMRLAYIVAFASTLNLQLSGYDAYASNLVAGHGYTRFPDLHPDSDLPPLYPFFLAGVYTVFGRSAITVALVQIAFDVVTLITIYAIGRRVGGDLTGLLAAAFTGFYPYLLFQNLTVNDTGIFIMLLALGVWAAYRALDAKAWRWALMAGAAFGLAALTKTLVVLMLPLLIVWWWRHLGLRRAILRGSVMLLVFAAVLAPWIIRNTRLHRTLTLISTNDGSNLYQGNNPCVADFLLNGWDAQWTNCLNPTPPGLTELQEAAWFRDQAIAYLRNHLDQWPRLFAVKFIALWSPDVMPRSVPPVARLNDTAVLQYDQPLFQAARIVHIFYFAPLLALGVLGLWHAWRDKRLIGPIVMVLTAITVAYVIYHPSTRYRSPADPFLFILSSYAVLWLWDMRKRALRL